MSHSFRNKFTNISLFFFGRSNSGLSQCEEVSTN